jgi:hypothetical protein
LQPCNLSCLHVCPLLNEKGRATCTSAISSTKPWSSISFPDPVIYLRDLLMQNSTSH